MTDHAVETYRPQDGPVVLMWREFRNSFNKKLNPEIPQWTRDDQEVHSDWKKYGRDVARALEDKNFTVVKVSRKIREFVKHGSEPDRNGKREDDWYKTCLPSATNMVMGIVVFPRDAYKDHPLVFYSRKKRAGTAATGVVNAVKSVRKANDLGNLSNDVRDEILETTHTTTREAFTDKYPLFKQIEVAATVLPD